MANPYKGPNLKDARAAFAKAYETGASDVGVKAHQLKAAQGGLFVTIKEMLVNMWNSTVGSVFKSTYINATADAGKVADGLIRAQHDPRTGKDVLKASLGNKDAQLGAIKNAGKVGLVERIVTKPFKIAKNHPRLALIGGALFGAKYMSDKHNREQRLEALSQYAAQNPMPQNSYYNSVTPDEYAAMQAQMRGPNMQGGFANREMARRAEQQALAEAQQAPVA